MRISDWRSDVCSSDLHELLYQNLRRPGATSSDANTIVPSGIQIGVGVRAAGVYRIHEQGNLTTTGNSYDIAINGKGFYQVTLPSGETAYTRAGSFQEIGRASCRERGCQYV